jgi:hypothetical protein
MAAAFAVTLHQAANVAGAPGPTNLSGAGCSSQTGDRRQQLVDQTGRYGRMGPTKEAHRQGQNQLDGLPVASRAVVAFGTTGNEEVATLNAESPLVTRF